MEEKTLVILAAGMGSRFGGMKQVEPVGPNGEFLMDYSIYSAIKYGFNKVVLIIREEYLDLFKSTIGERLEGKVQVEYAFQDINDIPEGFTVPEGRTKPWGTAHAIYAARDYINGPFGVITADDFYGDNAFKQLSEAINDDEYVVIGYEVGSTLSDNGSVKRGVILHEDGVVNGIVESSCIKADDVARCTPLDETKEPFTVELDHPVSMLLNGFNTHMLDAIGATMRAGFEANKDKLDSYEMLLPDIMDDEIKKGRVTRVIPTTSVWMGMTYKEDLEAVKAFIQSEIDNGVYPEHLWESKGLNK